MNPYQNYAAMQGHVAQWQASNLSQAEYCNEHDIKPHILSYYKKKFSSNTESAKQLRQLIPVKQLADESLSVNKSSGYNVLRLSHANG